MNLADQGTLRLRRRAAVGCACPTSAPARTGTIFAGLPAVGSLARFNDGKTPTLIGRAVPREIIGAGVAEITDPIDRATAPLGEKLGLDSGQTKAATRAMLIGLLAGGATLAYAHYAPKSASPLSPKVLPTVAAAGRDFTRGEPTWPILSGVGGWLLSGAVANTVEALAMRSEAKSKERAFTSMAVHGAAAFAAWHFRGQVGGNLHSMLTGALARQVVATAFGPAMELAAGDEPPPAPPPPITPQGTPIARPDPSAPSTQA